jgi:hypothetical protein
LIALQTCADTQCVEKWAVQTGLTYNNILLERNKETEPLLEALLANQGYRLIYEKGDYLVFER